MNTIRPLHIVSITTIAAIAALTAAAAVSAIHPQPVQAECVTAAAITSEPIPRIVITAKRLSPMEKLADLVAEKVEMLMS
jgi:hypothetical protein